jgi:hypothetical protein
MRTVLPTVTIDCSRDHWADATIINPRRFQELLVIAALNKSIRQEANNGTTEGH